MSMPPNQRPKKDDELRGKEIGGYYLRDRSVLTQKKQDREASEKENSPAPLRRSTRLSRVNQVEARNQQVEDDFEDEDDLAEELDDSESSSSSEDEDYEVDSDDDEHPPAARAAASAENLPYEIEEMPARATFADLAGMDALKTEIFETIIDPFSFPRQMALMHTEAPKGIFLSGPPGTGKTKLAEAIVSAIRAEGTNVKFYAESGSCMNRYFGETENRIRKVFQVAAANHPAVILLDEIDGLGGRRTAGEASGALRTVVTTLLCEMNKVQAGQVMVIAATNNKEIVDPALVRPGRFCVHLDIPLPDAVARRGILEIYMEKKALQIAERDLLFVANRSEGFSGAGLERLVSVFAVTIRRRIFPNGQWKEMSDEEIVRRWQEAEISRADIESALRQVPRSENPAGRSLEE